MIYHRIKTSTKDPLVIIRTSWTWSSLFYYGGIAILSIGVLYIGYNLYYEPSYIYKLLGIDYKGKGRGPSGPGPYVEVFNAEDIEEGVASKIGAAGLIED